HGLVNNPQFKIGSFGHLEVDYQYVIGKIGLDSNACWVAFIDISRGKVFVSMFQPQTDQLYPEDTTVQIWTQGKGTIYSRNQLKEFEDDQRTNPPYMEVELLSPLHEIYPGESIKFEYHMLTATIPRSETIKDVNRFRIIVSPIKTEVQGDLLYINAK